VANEESTAGDAASCWFVVPVLNVNVFVDRPPSPAVGGSLRTCDKRKSKVVSVLYKVPNHAFI
jgi:hypothetical protein